MPNLNPASTALYTAVVTPFTADYAIDYKNFKTLLLEQAQAGNGIVILGSTGEGLALSESEKQEVVTFTSALALYVPVLVGVSGFQLPQTLDFLSFCEKTNISGYLMPVPLYAKPGTEGQVEWFTALMNHVTRPTMIYNVPSRAGVKLQPEALRRLSNHRNAWSVKEASGSVAEFCALKKAAPNLAFYSGDDALMPAFVKEGAVGLVSVASNAWPTQTNRYTRLSLEKKSGFETLWEKASNSLFTASNPVPVKRLMKLQARLELDIVRAPLSLNDLSAHDSAALQVNDQAIKQWFNSL
jgi:4-hydroxy-tetrahydrodipicolinate synthase